MEIVPLIFSFFIFSFFFFLLKILKFLIPRHFSRESVDPSIKFSNLPIKSFHYKSIIRSIVSRFHLRGFYPKNHTARQFSASCYELQNRDARPSDRGIFRMEQWTVAQKGWRDIGEGKRICVGGYERERERESQRFFARYFRSIENALSLDCRWHCFSRCPIEPLTKTLFNLI